MTKLRLLMALCLLVPAMAATSAVALPSSGTYSYATPRYEVSLSYGDGPVGVLLKGTVAAGGRTATLSHTVNVVDFTNRWRAPAPLIITRAKVDEDSSAPTLTLDVYTPVQELSGSVALSFHEERILQRTEFHVPSGAVSPILESDVRLDWSTPFGLSGSATSGGAITFDDGSSLDPYGEWQDTHRYGVFVSNPGGSFVGHARITQGDQANYISEGSFRTAPSFTRSRTYFNGFLDAPTAGLPQGLWALDSIEFMSDGSSPGAFAQLLGAFPGFEPFSPPDPGDLQANAQVVIAVADTGINPYHEDFRNPAYSAHPSTYITGFPTDATALDLTFGAEYDTARKADDGPVWSKVEQNRLYWIPGTKIVGAFSIGSPPGSLLGGQPPYPPRFIIDDQGHGTGVASVSTGYRHGSCPECLLVVIEGTERGVQWAASQPWIDMISNSYGPLGSVPVGNSHDASRAAFRAGKSVLYSAGNGMSGLGAADRNPSFTRPGSGPSWVITVGAASPRNDQDHHWHGIPSDVISYGSNYPAAAHLSVTGEQTFSGTSCATPITAGVEGSLLLAARRALGDAEEGTPIVMASRGSGSAPAHGPLADGDLTRDELEDVLFKTAIAREFTPGSRVDPTTIPSTPASFVWEGYGLVNKQSLAHGLLVLKGEAPLPDRPTEDAWIAATDRVRDRLWGVP